MQRHPGGDAVDEQTSDSWQVTGAAKGDGHRLVRNGDLGVAAGPLCSAEVIKQRGDRLPGSQSCYALSDGADMTGHLDARDERSHQGQSARVEQGVEETDPGEGDINTDLAIAWTRLRPFADNEGLWAADLTYDHRAHASILPSSRPPIVFTGESAVRFEPNSTVFSDPTAAITPIAHWLAADPARRATLEGTTADVGTLTDQIQLSLLRADQVCSELITLGAAPTQITTTVVGSHFPQFIPDRTPAGTLRAGPATLNRSVRITLRQ